LFYEGADPTYPCIVNQDVNVALLFDDGVYCSSDGGYIADI
jgi:hypothetical protein